MYLSMHAKKLMYSGANRNKRISPPPPSPTKKNKTNNTYESHNPCIIREVIQTIDNFKWWSNSFDFLQPLRSPLQDNSKLGKEEQQL